MKRKPAALIRYTHIDDKFGVHRPIQAAKPGGAMGCGYHQGE